MAIAPLREEKRIFDKDIIKSYCKAKYGFEVVNMLGKTIEQQQEEYAEQEAKNPSWLHIYKVLPVGDYLPKWEHQFKIIEQLGLSEETISEFRNSRLDNLLD